MKYATLKVAGGTRVAVVEDGMPGRLLDARARDIASLIADPSLASAISGDIAPDDALLAAPILRPQRNVFCVGKNYHDHAQEFSRSGFDSAASDRPPDWPIIFSKVPEAVIAGGESIVFDPAVSAAIDYEGELAVIIGTGGKGITKDRALSHVWGYTILNDVTARDWQSRMKQWHIGKSFDTFCPMGPWAVTADEVDVVDLLMQTRVNGELRQEASTRDLIFDVPTVIETLAAGITLHPGDIIAMGTPAGVGIGFTPPKYLRDGDVVSIEIAGLGVLENKVAAAG